MGKSADEVTVMEVARTVRRKLTQSTLFPCKAENSSAEKVPNFSDDDDGECSGTQGRKKRKPRGKSTTPQPKPAKKKIANGNGCPNGMMENQDFPSMKSPRKPRQKQQTNITPSKKVKARMNSSAEPELPTEEKPQTIPDLRLEAKLSAEENSRIFAGKQIHPFFSSRKTSKIIRETIKADAGCCTFDKNDSSESFCPIHVFESARDDTPVLDWSRWIFTERSFFNFIQVHEMMDNSSRESFIDSVHFDNYLKVSCASSKSHADGISVDHYAGKGCHHPTLINENVEHEMGRIGVCSNHAGHGKYCVDGKKISILQNRNQGLINRNYDMLWTKKYQPEKATEVCGNIESVKYLSDWLHRWNAKDLQCRESANGGTSNASESSDHEYYESDSDSERISEGDKLKNVLLVTGPIGSGKSASIYACAKEEGFNVIEVNTSDWRNGALVRQKFGEAVESHSVNRLNEHEASQSKQHKSDSLNDHMKSQEAENEVVEFITVANEDAACSSVDMSAEGPHAKNKLPCDRDKLKTLVLFDDVDIAFTEDRGFIGAIQHLARVAKLPIILTTNSNQSILPDSLDREEIYFSRPSLTDILDHVIAICAAEKASIQPSLAQSFTEFFHGDIRKTIMHLQFWCQSTVCVKDKKLLENNAPQVFNLEVAHQLLMRLIPWGFASELSELIEVELNKSLNLQEEYSALFEANEDKLLNEIRHRGSQMHLHEDFMVAKKDAMLKRSNSYHNPDPYDVAVKNQDKSNSSGSPIAFSRKNKKRKCDYVLSLSEDDEVCDYKRSAISVQVTTHAGISVVDCEHKSSNPKPADYCSSSVVNNLSLPDPSLKILPLETKGNLETQIQFSENDLQIQDSCGVADISCVPESSFVPETRINDEQEESCRSVSYDPSSDMMTAVSSSIMLPQNLTIVEVECYDECLSRLHIDSQNMVNSYDINVESIHNEDVGDSLVEHFEIATGRWQLMDECSQMDFNRGEPIHRNDVCEKTGLVQEAWDRLRESHQDLGKYVTSDQKYASPILKVTFAASNLMSEADLLSPDFQLAGNCSAEPSTFPSEQSDAFRYYDEQLHITTTFFDHGFHLYAKDVKEVVASMSQKVDSAQEMSTCNADMMVLGKLVAQGVGTSKLWQHETSDCGPSEREANSGCLDIVRSIVPPRSYLVVRGETLHEYISCLNNISRSETSRLSSGVDDAKGRRGRFGHYLCGDRFSLSMEDLSLLERYPTQSDV
uniref:AAA+ ATPase domain-containing protein n=1 Tax=Kalanchoe fedtschenkoi TaxID=63787 RepID=A0A7N0ZV90_KALFE